MATGRMYDCEASRPHKVDGKTIYRWVPMPVKHVPEGTEVRCGHCHGPVRVHRQQVPEGPQDHVEHKPGNDVKTCRGGGQFKEGQVHQMSMSPVLGRLGDA